MKQADLNFNGKPVARPTDPETSWEAASDATKHFSENMGLALRLIAHEPRTDYDLEAITGMQKNSIGKRRSDLYRLGYVAPLLSDDGTIAKRPGPSGSKCIVWAITEAGKSKLSESLNES